MLRFCYVYLLPEPCIQKLISFFSFTYQMVEKLTPEEAFALFQQSILGQSVLSPGEYSTLKGRAAKIVHEWMTSPLPRNFVHLITPMRTLEDFTSTKDIRVALEVAGYAVFDPTTVETDWMTKSDLDNRIINNAHAAFYNARRGVETHGASAEIATYLRKGTPVIALTDPKDEHMKRLLSAYPLSIIGDETWRGYIGRGAHVVENLETGLTCLNQELQGTLHLEQRTEKGKLNYSCDNCNSIVLRAERPYSHASTSTAVIDERRFNRVGYLALAAQVALLAYTTLTFQPKTYNDLPPERRSIPAVANRFADIP